MSKTTMATKSIKAEQREATQSRILQTARKEFAASGYDGTSVRRIATESGIELSLILYHFKSKEGLYRAVFDISSEVIFKNRLERLQKALKTRDDLTVIEVLQIYCASWVEMMEGEDIDLAIFSARSRLDSSKRQIELIKEVVDPGTRLFIDALKQAAPDASEIDIHRCYHLFAGAMQHLTLDHDRIVRISGETAGDVRAAMLDLAQMIERRLLHAPD